MQINKTTPESAPEEYIDSTAPTITDICINPHEIPAVLDTLEKKLGSENMTVLIACPAAQVLVLSDSNARFINLSIP